MQNGKFRINLFILQLRLSPSLSLSLSLTHIHTMCPVVIFHKLPLPFQTFFNWNLRLVYGERRKFHLHSLEFLSLCHQIWLAQFSAQQIFYISGQLWWKTFAENIYKLVIIYFVRHLFFSPPLSFIKLRFLDFVIVLSAKEQLQSVKLSPVLGSTQGVLLERLLRRWCKLDWSGKHKYQWHCFVWVAMNLLNLFATIVLKKVNLSL
jgi:hypothetical protein